MKSFVAVILLGIVCAANAATCPHTCSRQEKYYVGCGFFNWSRCTRYRTVTYSCEQTCYHGGWTDWTVASEGSCSATCGGGEMTVSFQRSCTNPAPFNGGNDCEGDSTKQEQQDCNTQSCPIDGGWSEFSQTSVTPCTVSCGSGTKDATFTRTCSAPTPQYGGHDCQGESTEMRQQSCNTNPCPIDGGWSEYTAWQDYDECSALCGGGTKDQWRTRTCTNPPPAYGGQDCQGETRDNHTVGCNKKKCGSKCPPGTVTYVDNANTENRYYMCDNGVARLKECPENTRWDQNTTVCVHAIDQQALAVPDEPEAECDSTQLVQKHPTDCGKYNMCVNGALMERDCAPGLRFNENISTCDFAYNVQCDDAA